jgi:glycosyltransferase involved in cell wall biosynthesis
MSYADNVALLTIGDLSESIDDYGYKTDTAQIITPLIPSDLLVDEINVNDRVTDLLYAGRLSAEKGVEELLEGFKQLLTVYDDIHLHIVGSGPQSTYLKQLSKTLEIDSLVTFHGFVPPGPELWSHFDEADLFVLFSRTEGLPRVVAEAMSRGTPVITSAVGGLPNLINSGKNGLLVEPEDVHDFVITVKKAIRDQQLRTQLAAGGRDTAVELTFESSRYQLQTFLAQELFDQTDV